MEELNWKTRFKRSAWTYLVYNFYVNPFIIMIYLPYYFFIIHYSLGQVETWLLTSYEMSLVSNLAIAPYVAYIVKNRLPKWTQIHS